MSGEDKGSLKAILSAAGAGGMFVLFWLGLGVPLPFSAAAGAAGYGALWLVLGNAFGREKKTMPAGSYVNMDLAKKTSAMAFTAAKSLDDEAAKFPPRDSFVPRFKRLAELLRAIGHDVESDPKDAEAASVFVSLQGETGARLAKLCLALETRGASRDQLTDARGRISTALDALIVAHERHLAHLQEDNIAELQSELEMLEQSLGFEEEFEKELRKSQGAVTPEAGERKATGKGR